MSTKTIVVTGAGSGGHITPLLAVAAELKSRDPEIRIIYIGQIGDALGDVPANDPNIDETYTVRAGKFRRYHGEGLKQLLDLKTMFLNLRDAVFVLAGIMQAWVLLRKLRPDVIFVKGGFVGVPVGLAAAQLKLPFVTHDSDAVPGLANRIIAKWAARHAVALPKEVYAYPSDTTVTTGIPLQKEFVKVNERLKEQYRKGIGVPADAKLLFVIGGGLGSQRVNGAVGDILQYLLQDIEDLYVVHFVGRANEEQVSNRYKSQLSSILQRRVQVFGYRNDVYRYSGAADAVVTRAGATNLAEFALQGKACIVVPSPFLTGGHQLKNAQVLEERGAALVLPENELLDDPNRLAKQITQLVSDGALQKRLGERLHEFSHEDAAQLLAVLLLEVSRDAVRP